MGVKNWKCAGSNLESEIFSVQQKYSLPRPVAMFLVSRGISGDAVAEFLEPRLGNLSDPYRFPGIHYWLVECNYCEELLTEDTPPVLSQRLSTSHMSLDRLCQVFQANELTSCRKIILCHLSRDRGDPDMMKRRIRDQTHKPVEVTRAGYMHDLTLDPF